MRSSTSACCAKPGMLGARPGSRSCATIVRRSPIAVRAVSPITSRARAAPLGSMLDSVAGTVALRCHDGPRVGDDVVHVGGDPASLLLDVVEVAQSAAFGRLELCVDPGLHPLPVLPAHEPRHPAACRHDCGQRGEAGGEGDRRDHGPRRSGLCGHEDACDHGGHGRAAQAPSPDHRRAVRAEREEQRGIPGVGTVGHLAGGDLHDGTGDRDRRHRLPREPSHCQCDSEQDGGDGGCGPEAAVERSHDGGEEDTGDDVEDDLSPRRPGVSPHIGHRSRLGPGRRARIGLGNDPVYT